MTGQRAPLTSHARRPWSPPIGRARASVKQVRVMKSSFVDCEFDALPEEQWARVCGCSLLRRLEISKVGLSRCVDINCGEDPCLCDGYLNKWRELPWSKMPKWR
jgi:hypothetical protein